MSYYIAGGKYIRVGNKLFSRIIPTITNYLYNGDFSNASSGWDIVGTGITISSSTGVMNIYGAWNEYVSQLGTTMLTPLEPSSQYVLTFDAINIPTDQFIEFIIMSYGNLADSYTSNKQFGVNGSYSIKFSTPGTINNQGFGLYFQTTYEGTMDNLFLTSYVGNITASDNFESYSTGNLSGQGNWVAIRPSYPINVIDVSGDQRFQGSSEFNERCYTRTEAFSVDHYAQCTIESAPDDGSDTGVAVRCNRYYDSGWQEQFFAYYGHSEHRAVFYSINGSWVALSEVATGVSPGDVLRLEVEGNILRAYYNGSLDTVMDNGAIINVASIISTYPRLAEGTPGIATAGNGGSGDSFEAGDLAYTVFDGFGSYSSGSLDGQGNWQDGTGEGTHVVVVTGANNVVNGETGAWDGVARRMDINNANHFAELAITTLGGAQLGVVARSSGSLTTQDYFAYYVSSSSRTLQQVLNRTVTATVGTVASGGAVGDVIRIEAIDMSVYCYRNGRLDASLSGGGVYTIPSGMETGYPGIMSYGSSTQGDNFYAGYIY